MNKHTNQLLRNLPAVNDLLEHSDDLIAEYGRDAVLEQLRATLTDTRQRIIAGNFPPTELEAIIDTTREQLRITFQPTLRPLINATGVILHTNLGRSVLSESAQQAIMAVASNYSSLEFDMQTGKRGGRNLHASQLIEQITGAEAAMVVNNNASATVLMLAGLAHQREVIVSRGQLVEIGGGFRVPDIMAQSGATLVEVGTTNRTRLSDYEHAITENTALLMRVHSSNFKQIGFTEETDISDMAALAHHHDLLCADDLGSGALIDTAQFGLDYEPTVQESLNAGADVIAFSGDKLLGGPQAGILIGKKQVIERLKRHPLARAIRADKLCLAGLSATLDHYRRGEALQKIPVWQMISRELSAIEAAAHVWQQRLGTMLSNDHLERLTIVRSESTIGGGSLPGATMPTYTLSVETAHAEHFMKRLRDHEHAVIARIVDQSVLLDPRTVLPHQETHLLTALADTIQAVE